MRKPAVGLPVGKLAGWGFNPTWLFFVELFIAKHIKNDAKLTVKYNVYLTLEV